MTNLEPDTISNAGLARLDVGLFLSRRAATTDRANLRRVVPAYFYAKLFVLTALLTASALAVAATQGLTRLILQVFLGAVLAHATELIHQCLHRTATGRAARDQTLGMMIATPLGISFWRYLTDHFAHHKDVTKESFSYNYERMNSKSLTVRVMGFVLHASMINHFVDTIK
jgi:fatty acid desaturase